MAMWNKGGTGILVTSDDGYPEFIEDGPKFKKLAKTAKPWVDPVIADPPPSPDAVNAERDRRIAGGFPFRDAVIQSSPDALASIGEAAVVAMSAIVAGAKNGDARWLDPKEDFVWVTESNEQIALDAEAVVEMAAAAYKHKKKAILAARKMKDGVIPADFVKEKYWK